jgi:hypothetical protein
MNQSAARTSRPAGPRPAAAELAPLDYSDIEDTTPSTPYPCARFQAISRWFRGMRDWVLGKR